jgi:hypothetical protein
MNVKEPEPKRRKWKNYVGYIIAAVIVSIAAYGGIRIVSALYNAAK